MGFVLPERQRPSRVELARAFRRALLLALIPVGIALVFAGMQTAKPPLPTMAALLLVALLGGTYLARRFVAEATDAKLPWSFAFAGIVLSAMVTWRPAAWIVHELLAGTFGGRDEDDEQAEDAVAPPELEPEPEPAVPFEALPSPVPLVVEPLVEALPPPVEPLPVLPEPEPELAPAPLAAPPAPLVPHELLAAAAVAAPVAAPAPAPEPVPVELVPMEPDPVPEPLVREEPLVVAAPVVVEFAPAPVALPVVAEAEPAFLPHSDLDAVAAHDPFSTFWLDPAAPPADGLTPGYLPPLTAMWKTPLGDKL
jgi:hypothetical protein